MSYVGNNNDKFCAIFSKYKIQNNINVIVERGMAVILNNFAKLGEMIEKVIVKKFDTLPGLQYFPVVNWIA